MTPRSHHLPPTVDGQIVTVRTAREHGVSPDRLRENDLERRVYGVRGPRGSADDFQQRCRLFVHAGLRVSAPTRNLCEMSSAVDLPRLVAVADFFIRRRSPLCAREDLAHRLAVGDRLTRSGILRRAIELADDRSESPPESVLRVILTIAGIAPTATNYEVTVRGRRYRIDLAYVRERVAIEYQGGHHFDAAVRKYDMSRRSQLEAEGWIVVELNSDYLLDPDGVVLRVRAALRRSRAR